MDAPHDYIPSGIDYSYPLINEDRSMFAYQHTRQLSASPSPLFPYEAYRPTESSHRDGEPQGTNYFSIPFTPSELSSYSYSLPPLSSVYNACAPGALGNVKVQHYDEDDDINPFSLSYASMAGMEIPNSYHHHQTLAIHVSQNTEHPPQYIEN